MKTRLLALLATFVLLITCAVLTVSANGTTAQSAPLTPFVRGTDPCPCCGKTTDISWKELGAPTSDNPNLAEGHYVVTNPLAFTEGYYNITGSKKVVIVFENVLTGKSGSNIFRFGMGSDTFANCKAWLLGGAIAGAAEDAAYKYGAIIGTGASSSLNGSLMRMGKGADVTIGGALTIELSEAVTSGSKAGLFDVYSGNVTMTGGVLNGISSTSTSTTYGTVILRAGGYFTMSGGTINGGSATKGNAVYTSAATASGASGGTFTMSGGTINGGAATEGGAIYHGAGAVEISGGTIVGGTATNGGVIYVAGGTLTMTKGTITGGTATAGHGGTFYVADGEVSLNGGTVNGGTANKGTNASGSSVGGNGGAIYMAGGEVNLGGVDIVGGTANQGGCIYVNAGTVNMTAGTISKANGLGNGGTVFLKGTMNMSGGIVTVNPDNTYAYSKGIRVNNGVLNLSGNATVISAGKAEGDGVYVVSTNANQTAKVSMADNATVRNPSDTNAYNIFLSNWGPDNSTTRYSSKIEIAADWSGTASVKFGYIYSSSYAAPGAAYSIGMNIPADYASAAGDFNGSLYMEVAPGAPALFWDDATGLKASDVQVVKKVDGQTVTSWAKNNNAAVAAYNGGYIKLLTDNPIDLQGREVYVDFNGNNVAVTLSGGKLYGLDNTATVSNGGLSCVTVTDGDPEGYAQNPVTGQHIIAMTKDGKVSFHTVDVKIQSANLRISVAGIYYTAGFLCDEALKPYVDSFGVALSLRDMPETGFEEKHETLYTRSDGKYLGTGSCNSVLVQNIMKDQGVATNKNNAQMPIYASAYMKLVINGQTYTLMGEKAAQMSLKNVVERVDKQWHGLSETARNNMITQLYDAYVAKFEVNDWSLPNLKAEQLGLDKNRELKVLTIGNSLAVDATRMLAYVAQQEGSAGIKVGTLYKANCSVQEHADFLTNNKANYWYYESGFDANNPGTMTAGSLVPKETKNYVGYDAIVAEDWDIIVMQHSVFGSAQPNTYDESIDTIIDYVNTHKTNPNAIFVWNMTWMPPVDSELLATAEAAGKSPGFSKSYSSYTKTPLDREAQTMMFDMIADAVADKVCSDNRFAYILPSATMMQNALTATSDKVMYRDYIHGSDYGRLMNAYLWYSMFANKSITELKVDKIPGALRFAEETDMALTQRLKDVLVESVSNAKAAPYSTTKSAYQKEDSFKVLAIGNSFSMDNMWHLEDLARSEGYTDVKLGILYIGGSSLETNWKNADGDLAKYRYYYNYDANWEDTGGQNFPISQALAEQDWDIVTLQQASGNSGQDNTFEPYLANLIDYVQKNEPGAKIVWNMTWAYAQDSTHSSFPNYDNDQMTMYNAIIGAVENVVVPYVTAGQIDKIIPCGTAVQNARTSFVGDKFNRDGYHLNILGRILTACTWYSVLTGNELDEISVNYFNDCHINKSMTLTDADKDMIVEAVKNAIDKPYQITPFAD